MTKHLFVFGGGPPFTPKLAKRFAEISLLNNGKLSILLLERDNWQAYMPRYTDILMSFGVKEFQYIPLPTIEEEEAVLLLKNSSGIIIGGGNTNLYADFIVDTKISTSIIRLFNRGVPIAGFSAGALISMNPCIISAKDNNDRVLQSRNGLGLLIDTILSVHFSEWQEQDHLLIAVKKFTPYQNYGINEQTGIYFCQDYLAEMEGNGVYSIKEGEIIKLLG